MIKDNLLSVEEKIIQACKNSGRDEKEVKLIAVSKTKPNEDLEEAYAEGIRDFGENYVQELTDKIETLPDDINWHMIGHLQRNKVKYIVGKVKMIHSVESMGLVEEISKRSEKLGIVTDILIEVNIGGEDSKFGLNPEDVEEFVREASNYKGVKIKGLMTSAPYVVDPEENRGLFRQMKSLSIDIGNKNIDNVCMCELSMGMTNDYVVAVEEGATLVRVGTAIFGKRDYSNIQ